MEEKHHITLNGERATVLVYSDAPLAPDVLEIVIEREAEYLDQEQFGAGGTFAAVGPRAFTYAPPAPLPV